MKGNVNVLYGFPLDERLSLFLLVHTQLFFLGVVSLYMHTKYPKYYAWVLISMFKKSMKSYPFFCAHWARFSGPDVSRVQTVSQFEQYIQHRTLFVHRVVLLTEFVQLIFFTFP